MIRAAFLSSMLILAAPAAAEDPKIETHQRFRAIWRAYIAAENEAAESPDDWQAKIRRRIEMRRVLKTELAAAWGDGWWTWWRCPGAPPDRGWDRCGWPACTEAPEALP